MTWLFDHDPANECLVTGLFRIALAQRSKNTVRCCDLWPVLVFLAEARGILRLRLTITYHEGRGSEGALVLPNRDRQGVGNEC